MGMAVECAPDGGQFQAAVLTVCRAWCSSNCAVQSYFAIGARLHRNHELVSGVKRREGGGFRRSASYALPAGLPLIEHKCV